MQLTTRTHPPAQLQCPSPPMAACVGMGKTASQSTRRTRTTAAAHRCRNRPTQPAGVPSASADLSPEAPHDVLACPSDLQHGYKSRVAGHALCGVL